MADFVILHGTGGTPESFWFPYVKRGLESLGYKVWCPQLPDTDNPSLEKQLPFIMNNDEINKDTTFICHSASCALILSFLEKISFKIKKSIFVSGFVHPLDEDQEPILQEKYDWEKIKGNCEDFIFINSDNDPWGCDQKHAQEMFDNLGGTMIIRHGQGHMGSDYYNQPYKEFPLLLKLIE